MNLNSEPFWILLVSMYPILITLYHTLMLNVMTAIQWVVPNYRFHEAHHRYLSPPFKYSLALGFLIVGPNIVSFKFSLIYSLFLPAGYFMYRIEMRIWSRLRGIQIDQNGADGPLDAGLLVLSAVAEELLFRGALSSLLNITGMMAFVIVSSVSFGLSHVFGGWREVLLKIIDGIVYAVVFLVTGSIWASVFLHVGFNLSYAYILEEHVRFTLS